MSLLDVFTEYPFTFILFAGVLGLVTGSFLNVVIYRLPVSLKRHYTRECKQFLVEEAKLPADMLDLKSDKQTEPYNLVVPASHCPTCGHKITALENIPILSYLFLRGKCRSCGTAISIRYPLIEALSALLAMIVAWQLGFGTMAVAAIILTWALIALTFIDFDHLYLPDNITLPFLWLGLLLNIHGTFTDLESAIYGAIAGYMSLWLVYHAFKLITGKEGMGYGDFKLLALFGAWFGWQILPMVILFASFVGAVVGISLIVLKKHERQKPIPFGPYLATAGWIAMLWGEYIQQYYFQFLAFNS